MILPYCCRSAWSSTQLFPDAGSLCSPNVPIPPSASPSTGRMGLTQPPGQALLICDLPHLFYAPPLTSKREARGREQSSQPSLFCPRGPAKSCLPLPTKSLPAQPLAPSPAPHGTQQNVDSWTRLLWQDPTNAVPIFYSPAGRE